MIEIIATIIFLVSVAGIIFILSKKVSVLVTLPRNGHHGFKKSEFVSNIEKKVKKIHFDLFSRQVFLHKLLSWFKVWILKTETKIDQLLHRIRKKAQQLDKEVKKKK